MNSSVPPKVYEVVKKVVNGDIDNFVVTVDHQNKKGEGYLGEIFFISLQDKRNGKRLYFVVKQAFSEKNIRELSHTREVFLNEIYFYTKLWPTLSEFQERIPSAYHFDNVGKCLAAIPEDKFERLVLENLKEQRFVMHDKKKTLGKEMFELIFKCYGRFHAISFAYKALNPESFSELAKELIEVHYKFAEMDSFKDYTKYTHEQCLETLRATGNEAVVEKYRHYAVDGIDLFVQSLVNGKYTAIIHGDCWSNNMMFKYDETGKLIDLKLLDFQLVRLGNPVCDLSYCLYSGGTKEIFDDLDHLLQVYHDSLSESLRAYGCDPDELYPLQALKDDWKVYCQLGFTVGLSLWRTKLIEDEELVDLTDIVSNEGYDMDKFKATKFDENTYKKLTKDLLLHLYEKNYML